MWSYACLKRKELGTEIYGQTYSGIVIFEWDFKMHLYKTLKSKQISKNLTLSWLDHGFYYEYIHMHVFSKKHYFQNGFVPILSIRAYCLRTIINGLSRGDLVNDILNYVFWVFYLQIISSWILFWCILLLNMCYLFISDKKNETRRIRAEPMKVTRILYK